MGSCRGRVHEEASDLPTLRALILDFSSVSTIDFTSAQHLVDVQDQLDRWASPGNVEWYFVGVHNPWTKRALLSSGFGQSVQPDKDTAISGPQNSGTTTSFKSPGESRSFFYVDIDSALEAAVNDFVVEEKIEIAGGKDMGIFP